MRRFIMLSISAALIAAPAAALAQRADGIRQGAKVRVSTGNVRKVGFLDSMTSDSLSLRVVGQNQASSTLNVGRAEVTRLEVRGTNRFLGALRGAGIGFAAGTVSGFTIGILTHRERENCFLFCEATDSGFLLGVLGAVIGTPVGLIGGAVGAAGTWKRLDPTTTGMR